MRRIAEEELLRLKAAVPLERLCAKYGIELKPHGSADLIGRCPFHEDRTPSFESKSRGQSLLLTLTKMGGRVRGWHDRYGSNMKERSITP